MGSLWFLAVFIVVFVVLGVAMIAAMILADRRPKPLTYGWPLPDERLEAFLRRHPIPPPPPKPPRHG